MRRIYELEARDDRTPGQKKLREMFDGNPERFIMQLARLEREFAQVKQPAPEAAAVDEGDMKQEELIQRLIRECVDAPVPT